MKDGNIHWRMISIYAGEARWYSSGVQIGGPQSGSGVYGMWSGVDHARDDPAGPFVSWKPVPSSLSDRAQVLFKMREGDPV
jgi:hypothetical protein